MAAASTKDASSGPAAEARGAPAAGPQDPPESHRPERRKPPVLVRLAIVAALAAFASLDSNPLVRLQAEIGLSPSPLERFFGVRGPFSGMTEATWRLTELDLGGSLRANLLAIPLLGAVTLAILLWKRPRMRTRRHEVAAIGLALAAAAINNAAPAFLS